MKAQICGVQCSPPQMSLSFSLSVFLSLSLFCCPVVSTPPTLRFRSWVTSCRTPPRAGGGLEVWFFWADWCFCTRLELRTDSYSSRTHQDWRDVSCFARRARPRRQPAQLQRLFSSIKTHPQIFCNLDSVQSLFLKKKHHLYYKFSEIWLNMHKFAYICRIET